MIVCEKCLKAIESHEGYQMRIEASATDCEVAYGYYDEDGNFVKEDEIDDDRFHNIEEYVWCEWCESFEPLSECYEI